MSLDVILMALQLFLILLGVDITTMAQSTGWPPLLLIREDMRFEVQTKNIALMAEYKLYQL